MLQHFKSYGGAAFSLLCQSPVLWKVSLLHFEWNSSYLTFAKEWETDRCTQGECAEMVLSS